MTVFAAEFETEEKARDATTKLIEAGFEESAMLAYGGADGMTKLEEAVGSTSGRVVRPLLNRVRAALEAGHSVVAVNARLFSGRTAEKALRESGAAKLHEWTELSSFFSDDSTSDATETGRFGLPLSTSSKTPLSSLLGIPLLTAKREKRA